MDQRVSSCRHHSTQLIVHSPTGGHWRHCWCLALVDTSCLCFLFTIIVSLAHCGHLPSLLLFLTPQTLSSAAIDSVQTYEDTYKTTCRVRHVDILWPPSGSTHTYTSTLLQHSSCSFFDASVLHHNSTSQPRKDALKSWPPRWYGPLRPRRESARGQRRRGIGSQEVRLVLYLSLPLQVQATVSHRSLLFQSALAASGTLSHRCHLP